MNSCFEGLEGRMGLNRVREFIPKAGKKCNERVKVSVILDFGSFTRRGLLADLEHPVEIWGREGTYCRQSRGARPERRLEDRKTSDLLAVRGPKTRPHHGRYQ